MRIILTEGTTSFSSFALAINQYAHLSNVAADIQSVKVHLAEVASLVTDG